MVKECFNCGISEDKVKLFDAISPEGIDKICEDCATRENIPIVKWPSGSNIRNKEAKRESVYSRLSRMSGVDPAKRRVEKTISLKKQEETLKGIIDKNYSRNITNEPKPDFLINNFHWAIMRARRTRHMTQGQLAKEIGESEAAIRTVERGLIPRGIYDLVKKIEDVLNIRITKEEFKEKMESSERKIGFDPVTTRSLTIADLKTMKNEEEIDEEPLFDDEDFDFED